MRIRSIFLMCFAGLLIGVSVALAQGQCPALVEMALTSVGDSCAGLDRNAACYGYNQVFVTFSEAQELGVFSRPSDRADLPVLQTLSTAPLDLDNRVWGVAVMNVQANVPNSLPGQAVMFILMGDAEVTNVVSPDQAAQPAEPVDVAVQTVTALRSGPALNTNVIATVQSGAVVSADALSQDGEWLRAVIDNRAGWIHRSALDPAARVGSLPVVTPETRTPMQAFYFSSGLGQPACNEAPSALAVRSPENIRVDLTINGANIHLGSLVTFQSGPNNTLNMTVHEGGVEDDEGNRTGEGETREGVLDENGNVIEWGDPRPANENERQAGITAMLIEQALEGGEPEATETPEVTETPDVCAPTTHIVQAGENLYRIAQLYDASMVLIAQDNNLADPSLIFVGQELTISQPCSGFQGLPQLPAVQTTGGVEGGGCVVLTSPPPGGTVGYGPSTVFTWLGTAGATNYTVNIYNPQGDLWYNQTTPGAETSLALDTSKFGVGDTFLWDVTALNNGVPMCTSARQSFTRGPAPAPVYFGATWACSALYQFTVSYSNLDAGESVIIKFNSSPPVSGSGQTYTVPPYSQTFGGGFSPITVSTGSVMRVRTGEVVMLPGSLFC